MYAYTSTLYFKFKKKKKVFFCLSPAFVLFFLKYDKIFMHDVKILCKYTSKRRSGGGVPKQIPQSIKLYERSGNNIIKCFAAGPNTKNYLHFASEKK